MNNFAVVSENMIIEFIYCDVWCVKSVLTSRKEHIRVCIDSLILEFTGVIRKSRWDQLIRVSVDSGVSDSTNYSDVNSIDDHYHHFGDLTIWKTLIINS